MRNINIQKVANIVSIFVITALMLVPLVGVAQFEIPDPNQTGSNVPDDATVDQIVIRVINFLLAIAGLIAVVFLIVGGFRYITAGGNEDSAEQGKKYLLNSIIGLAIIILSFVIVRVISNALTDTATGP